MSEDEVKQIPTTPYKVTRGGAYQIEGILQQTAYTTTPGLTRRAARLRRKLRNANPAKLGEVNFEEAIVRATKMSDIEWAEHQKSRNELFDKWQDEEVTLHLTKKEADFLAHKALKWAFANRDKVFTQNNDHVLSVIEAFELEDDGAE